jgi:polysaccharide chain length determinant protein (PEP-CTERM system associated)
MSDSVVDQVVEQVRGAWRFRWIAMAATWVVCVLGWIVVFAMPDMYAATARVFVDTRTALGPLLQGLAVDSDVDSQLDRVKTALLGRPQLERVARETGLDLASSSPQTRSKLIDGLRDQIKIEGGPASRDTSGGLYVISYQDRSRDKSIQVVDRLLSSFVEDTLGGKREGSESAQRFLREQIAEYEKRLSESEQRLADFKKKNVGMMPGQQGDYFSRLQNEMDAAKKAETSLGIAVNRRDELQRQLRGEVPYVSGGASSGTSSAGGAHNASGSGDTTQRIQETQARLDELLLRFTDKHPDVIAARETLEQLKARRSAELEALRRGDPGAAASVGAASNPVYQSIQLQLNQTDVEIAALRGELNDHRQKIAQLRGLVDTVPEVEAEYAKLNRDYDVTHKAYNELLDRLQKAKLTESAAETGVVKFQVVDPPSASFAPVAPARTRLLIMVLVAAIGAGGGLAYLLHTLRPVFNNVRALAEATGLTVLGAVSMTWLDRRTGESRMRKLAFSGAAATLLVAFVGVIAFHDAGARLMQHVFGTGSQ